MSNEIERERTELGLHSGASPVDVASTSHLIDPFPSGAGNDIVTITYPHTDPTLIDGGAGTDTLIVAWGADPNNMTFALTSGSAAAGYGGSVVDTGANLANFTNFEDFNITTGTGSDSITTGDNADTVTAGTGGADTIALGGGIDHLIVDFSNDTNAVGTSSFSDAGGGSFMGLYDDGTGRSVSFSSAELINISTGSGNDQITVGGAATVSSGSGDDQIHISGDMTGASFQAGSGNDTLILDNTSITLSNFVAATDGIEQLSDGYNTTVNATAASDTIDFTGTTNLGIAIVIQGQGGADSLFGSDSGDTILGGGGNDTLGGNAGADSLDGNAGNNSLAGGTGADTLSGESGHDTLNGNDDNDVIYADQGFHSLGTAGTSGLYAVDGGAGDDIIVVTGDVSGSTFQGNIGNDTLNFETTTVTLSNFVATTASIEQLSDGYNTTVNATAASDTIDFTGTTNVGVAFVIQGQGGADSLFGSDSGDTILGGGGNDTLGGNAGADSLDGGAGANSLSGGTGADTLVGENGHDTLNGNDDNDTIYADQGFHASGNTTVGAGGLYAVDGGAGDDTIVVAGDVSTSTFQGNTGNDTLNFETTSVTLSNFVATTASIEQLSDGYNTTVNATAASDTIDFTGATNVGVAFVIQGQGGADSLFGSDSGDTILGGAGNDTLGGNAGADSLDGNAGNNSLSGGTGADTLSGENGHDIMNGNDDNDVVYADQGFHSSGGTVGTGGLYTVDGGAGDDYIEVAGNVSGSTFQGNTGTDTFVFETTNVTLSNFVASVDGIEQITANNYNTTVFATAASDVIDFSGVHNLSVAIQIQGGAGNDSLLGSDGQEVINGGGGNDTLAGNDGADLLDGNAGANSLSGGTGADTLSGENGHDTLNGNDDNDVIYADQGLHSLGTVGTGGVYAVDGGAGDDYIEVAGDVTGSTFQGSAGTDVFVLETTSVSLSNFVASADGIEQVTENNYSTTINATAASDTIDFTGVHNLSVPFQIQGGAGNDSLFGSDGQETINGGAGNDTIGGNEGADVLDGNAGINSLSGGTGADTLVGENGHDTLNGNDDNDVVYADQGLYSLGTVGTGGIYVVDGGAGDDLIVVAGDLTGSTFQGNTGTDTLQLETTSVTLSNFVAVTDGIEQVTESNFNSTINATAASDVIDFSGTTNLSVPFEIDGQAGNDSLFGSNSNDTVLGGAGNDTIGGNAGDDLLDGQAGTNTASYVHASGPVTVDLNLQGGAQNTVGDGNDTLNNFQNLIGSAFADTLTGDGNNNSLSGGLGNDTLTGNAGADTLDGGAGSDSMVGGAGNDIYVVESAGDIVVEAGGAGSGTDKVLASISYTLGANVENLTLTGTQNLTGTGNSLANVITGNSGDNTLDGGSGADTLVGGTGNDTYIVDPSDTVTENAGEGTDTVKANFNYTLGANLENLTLTGPTGLAGTGNSLNNVITGTTGNDTLDGSTGVDTLIGGQGNDTYIVSNSSDLITENLNEGTDLVQASVSYTLSTNLENLTLTGASALTGTGNGLANVLTANNAGDTLDGGVGADTLVGGAGNDTFIVDNSGDVVVEVPSGGTDTVMSSISYTLATNVENLVLTASGLTGTGNSLANSLTGTAGSDTLDGGSGADTLVGGLGDDTYIVDNTLDVVTEAANAGTDTVRASASYTLSANVENLVLTGAVTLTGNGNTLNNVITANDAGDSLSGGAGNDTLIGGAGDDTLNAGSGVDSMAGGQGDDLYIVANSADVVTEAANAGIDTVQSNVTYTLSANVENLMLTGATAINGTGNALNNVITGSNGANTLDGGSGNDTLHGSGGADSLIGGIGGDLLDGGAGADTMVGGTGFDTYIVDNVGDVVVESAGGGTDQVQSSITYTLTANVENLQLTGHDLLDGTGNSLNNTLHGNTQNNVLNGEGGDDTINGGKGHDTVTYFDAASGVTVNLGITTGQNTGGSGTDTLASIENLTGSGFADTLSGNGKGNVINGGAGNDTIIGGHGADVLTGGGDNDTFVYNSVLDSTNKISDRITDLTNADLIDLHAVDANTTVAGDQAFVLVSAFDHHAGELMLSYNSTTNQTSVLGDTNGDGKFDFRILLDGDHHDFTNFVL